MDEITLKMPRERPFHSVAHLVLGGLATRLDLTVETLEDLQIAIDSLLEHAANADDVTIAIRVRGDAIEANVGPFRGASLRAELDRDDVAAVGLGRILTTVADGVDVAEDGQGEWVTLTKTLGSETANERS